MPDYAARIWMGEAELLSAPMRGRSTEAQRESVATARLPQNSPLLTFEKNGTARCFTRRA